MERTSGKVGGEGWDRRQSWEPQDVEVREPKVEGSATDVS